MAKLRLVEGVWLPLDIESRAELEGVSEVICFEADKITDDIRSIAQNRLKWRWFRAMEKTQVEKHRGTTAEEWGDIMKERKLLPIYERDSQEYATTMQLLRELKKTDEPKARQLKKFVLSKASTADATVSQFSEYLTYVAHYCAHENIQLPAGRGMEELAGVQR